MKAITTAGIIEGLRSRKDRSLGLSITTPELTSEEKAMFMELQGCNLQILFNPLDENNAPEHKVEKDLNTKSPSVRLRNVLFIIWKQGQQAEDFETYYKHQMEKIIEHLKGKIVDNI